LKEGGGVKRKVDLILGDRHFSFVTDEPDEKVEKILSYVREEYAKYTLLEEKLGFEKIIVLILLNSLSKYMDVEEELGELRQKYDKLLGEINRGISGGAQIG
jgi:hypothetical protein